ncbi:MAG TPA: MerR family transcriptional regulator [Puia sp.]|nr:MerR family transcriptional regulator [Puia sp.]
MDHFSISVLSRLSGVKPFTIRTWEKRYNALNPDRSEGNTRYYNNKQLRRLLNIVSLMEFEHKVSELSSLPDSTLFRMIEEKKGQSIPNLEAFFLSQLIASSFTYDEPHFTNIFAQCVARYGVKDAYTKVLYPMLHRTGILWNADRVNPANEHFITHLLRQKILTTIDLLASPLNNADSWLLFLPEGEFHETGLLIAHYLIRLSGKRSVYLGANLPLDALIAAAETIRPQHILLFFVHRRSAKEMKEYLRLLVAANKNAHIYAAGERLCDHVTPSKRMRLLESVSDLETLLK